MLSFKKQVSQKHHPKKAHLQGIKKLSLSACFFQRKRAFLCTSRKKDMRFNGSLTVEAALILPFFLLGILMLVCISLALQTMLALIGPIHQTAKKIAQDAYIYKEASGTDVFDGLLETIPGEPAVKGFSVLTAEMQVIRAAGKEKLDRSCIVGGSGGLSFLFSKLPDEKDMVDLIVCYRIRIPIQLIPLPDIPIIQRCRVHQWVGYEPGEDGKEQTVYVTAHGGVYHLSLTCTHLALSIRQVSMLQVPVLRNNSGAKYYPCESCGTIWSPLVYVTEDGNRFHTILGCSRIKRDIRAIPLSEAEGLPLCRRCGEGE